MIAAKNIYIQSAYEHLQLISQDEEKRLEYEAHEKAIRDYNQGMYEAEEKGKRESSNEIAKKLLIMGQSVDFIAQATGLTIEQVEKLKREF